MQFIYQHEKLFYTYINKQTPFVRDVKHIQHQTNLEQIPIYFKYLPDLSVIKYSRGLGESAST